MILINNLLQMRKSLKRIVLFVALFISASLQAAPVFNMPVIRIQPNGDTLRCLLSGDEFYHRLHDAADFTIIQNPRTGYWVYADTVHTDRTHWNVIATDYVADRYDPVALGLPNQVVVDREAWEALGHRYDEPKRETSMAKTSGRNHGTLNNIVIFIRFSDDAEISTTLSTINQMFNDSSSTATSMYSYFKKVSYSKLYIPTRYYPAPSGNQVISYQDSLPRSYYMPYDSSTNTNGYQDDNQRRTREFSLLERAVNYVNTNSPVPTSLNIDMDNDGEVDNVCFVVKGTYTGWSDLLWPHKWSLYDRYVYINGKRVYTFNLQLEGSGAHYFSSSTFCHEMFHTLGAPDLYRYYTGTDVSGVGSWDLMCSNSTPPQHMSAYMKWKYGNWLDSIPQIIIPGTYTLHSLGDDSYENCVYKIAAQEPHQWYVLEYRDNTERFEVELPGRGLLIYRIDDRFNGNASYDGVDYFDEVYLFRPNALNDYTNGNLSQAYFSGSTNRTSFTPSTNPYPWLTGNVLDSTIAITNVTVPGETISFTYSDLRGCMIPQTLSSCPTNESAVLQWSCNSPQCQVQYREVGSQSINSVMVSGMQYTLSGLTMATAYQWRVRGVCSPGDSSAFTDWMNFSTRMCESETTDIVGDASSSYYYLPVNNFYNYTYSQMIYTPEEVGGAKYIYSLSFNYQHTSPVTKKDACVIYLGLTDKNEFTSTSSTSFVDYTQLHKVYEGPMNFAQGWNTIVFDSAFFYDGSDNLVVAIDDNSGDYDGSNFKYYCTSTGSLYRSMTYYSDNNNPGPTSLSGSYSKSRKLYRADIKFTGCAYQEPDPLYEVTLQAVGAGSVYGAGSYHQDTLVTITATPEGHNHFVCWVSGTSDTIYDNPYSFTISSDMSFTAYFAVDRHMITVQSNDTAFGEAWLEVENGVRLNEAILDYGTTLSIYALPRTDVENGTCWFNGWNDNNAEMMRQITLTKDTSFTAFFSCSFIGIDEVDDGLSVWVTGDKIFVGDAKGRTVTLYDMLGRTMATKQGEDMCVFSVPAVGVYLLKVEGYKTRKVIVR